MHEWMYNRHHEQEVEEKPKHDTLPIHAMYHTASKESKAKKTWICIVLIRNT